MTPRQYGLCSMLLETETDSIICGKAFDKKTCSPSLCSPEANSAKEEFSKLFPNACKLPFPLSRRNLSSNFSAWWKKAFWWWKGSFDCRISDLLDNLPKVAGEQVCQSWYSCLLDLLLPGWRIPKEHIRLRSGNQAFAASVVWIPVVSHNLWPYGVVRVKMGKLVATFP